MSGKLMSEDTGVRCMWMRGGSSKGGYFLAEDVPTDAAARDEFLLRIMGSPDPRQIDGMGGASPLTSKVAIVSKSARDDADIYYLFLQVFVDQPRVSGAQPCGNILAGVGPFALERGLLEPAGDVTPVRIYQANTGAVATAHVPTPQGRVTFTGDAEISGVPGQGAGIEILMDVQPGKAGAVLPTGAPVDQIGGIACTLIDAGMPAVLMDAASFGLTGDEHPEALESNKDLAARIEAIRLTAGQRMGLGDVSAASVPKMCLLSPGQGDAHITTRCFIPHSVHQSLGVLCGVSIAAAMVLPEGPAQALGTVPDGDDLTLHLAHPTGALTLQARREGARLTQTRSLRTARKLMDGVVFT